jgi:hypothetical protein
VDQLVQLFQRVDLLLIQLYNSLLQVLALQLAATIAAQSLVLQTKQLQVIPFLFSFFCPHSFLSNFMSQNIIFFGGNPQKEVSFLSYQCPTVQV